MTGEIHDVNELRERWQLHWGVMDVMIGGKSSIDLAGMMIKDWHDATRFMCSYGFDPDEPGQARIIHATIIEVFNFFEKHLMPEEWLAGKKPDAEMLQVDDVRHFLLWASEKPGKANRLRQAWSCAILRVMHTIAHIESVYRLVDLSLARDQIMGKFRNHIFRDVEGHLAFGKGEKHVVLHAVEWKYAKSRESIILKLLHKRANVAETIYDLLGIRIVTDKLVDVILVAKYLREFYLITFPNCNPARVRNTLVDLEEFRKILDILDARLGENEMSPDEFLRQLEKSVSPMSAKQSIEKGNPHSASNYRSIQLTCRELIHVPNHQYEWSETLRRRLDSFGHDERGRQIAESIVNLIGIWNGAIPKSTSFFPFEVHILDRSTYDRNQAGKASHDKYKSSQIKAARRRVLQKVLRWSV